MSANFSDQQYLYVLRDTQPVAIITPHQRSIKTRFVTFTCAACLENVTQERFPGRRPSYCSENCRLAAAAERKRLSRVATGQSKGRCGKPRRQMRKQNLKPCITAERSHQSGNRCYSVRRQQFMADASKK